MRELETFSGTISFSTSFEVAADQLENDLFLDLGTVGEIAEVFVNGECLGVRAWGPKTFDITTTVRAGTNTLEIRVTNSMANRMEGAMQPSGLMGPVVLQKGTAL